MPVASVVIATRNRANELHACLEALSMQSVPDAFEVIVVDNGSQDATPEVLRSAAARGVRGLTVGEPNRAKARNAGIAAARGDLVIFCDDDTIAPQSWVSAHMRAHAGTAAAAVSGPIINVANARALPPPRARNFSRAFFCTCNVSAPKRELEAVGGFDERYDLYGWEDTDLGIRLRARGVRRVFAWDAYLYHVKPKETMQLERRRQLALEKGTMAARFVAKSPSWAVRLATGAYGLNFVRAAFAGAAPLRRVYERLASSPRADSTLARMAADALIDAAYVDALRAGLKRARG